MQSKIFRGAHIWRKRFERLCRRMGWTGRASENGSEIAKSSEHEEHAPCPARRNPVVPRKHIQLTCGRLDKLQDRLRCNPGLRRGPLWVTGCRDDGVSGTDGLPSIAEGMDSRPTIGSLRLPSRRFPRAGSVTDLADCLYSYANALCG
jgi:hypothetical protein